MHTYFDYNSPNQLNVMTKKNLIPPPKKPHPILKNCPGVCNILEMDFIPVMKTR